MSAGSARPAEPAAPTIVARQAIYDSRLEVVAYELLFRAAVPTGERPTDQDAATAEVLMAAFTDIGMNELVGDHKAFVNIPYDFIVSGYCETLPKDRVVLEILEDVTVDDRVIKAVRKLAADGFTIALDDFEFTAEVEPLIEIANIIKFDVLALTGDALTETVERVRPYKAKWLAEKVEQRQQIRVLKEMGFELFQGYALERPTIVRSGRTNANRIVMLQVVSELYKPELEISELVDILSRDPELIYALLRIVNSASFSQRKRIESLHQALVLLGLDGLRNWATMILMTRLADGSPGAITAALIRAKMCEKVARDTGVNGPSAFTVGLLSALPMVLGEPLANIVKRLSLEPGVEQALLAHVGPYGELLHWVLAYEAGDDAALRTPGAPKGLATAFLESVAWARALEKSMADAPSEPDAKSA